MAYWKLNAYDATFRIPEFKGIMQYSDQYNSDPRYADEANDVETQAGVLQPCAAPTILQYGFDNRIETLACVHRRWYSGSGSPDVLFAALKGKVYYLSGTGWVQVPYPTGVTSYQCNTWSCVAYETNPVGSTTSHDVLLMSNAKDGMILIDTVDFTCVAVDTKGKKFGVIERYAERIWGGAIADNPDMLMYSAPYDPTDWEANVETPEDGAGDISQPSWDGDSFTALRSFGAQLIAFKKNRVWRILGTDPGEYTFKEQYGGGAPFPNTVSVDNEIIFMIGKDGPETYDGLSVSPFSQKFIKDFWKTVNKDALDQMCAASFREKYYISLPTGTSQVNDTLLVYNKLDSTWLIQKGMRIEAFLPTEDYLIATSSSEPGKVMYINFDAWATGTSTGAAAKWVSPWCDLGYRNIEKADFNVFFTPEVKNAATTIKVTIQTENRSRTKEITVQPLTSQQTSSGKAFQQRKIQFGERGKRFRVIFEVPSGSTAPWRLVGGVFIEMDILQD